MPQEVKHAMVNFYFARKLWFCDPPKDNRVGQQNYEQIYKPVNSVIQQILTLVSTRIDHDRLKP